MHRESSATLPDVPGTTSTSVPDGATLHLHSSSSTSALDSSTSCFSGMSCEDIQGTLSYLNLEWVKIIAENINFCCFSNINF